MKIHWLTYSLLALAVSATSATKVKAVSPAPPASGQINVQVGKGWETPPEEFREVQRQGYHDGIEGARRDYDQHRRPDVNNREEFRHPHVPASAREDYREGFRRGYENAMSHMMNDRDRDHDHDHDHY